jgi:dihydroorotate dehydrogenase electron transfer subunit
VRPRLARWRVLKVEAVGAMVELTAAVPGEEEPWPGQFYDLACPGDWRLRRPMSYFRRAPGTMSFLFRVVGEGTRRLAGLTPGEDLEVLGPLGRGFPLTAQGPHVLVGGGSGVPPLWDLARRLEGQVTVWIGGRGAADVAAADLFPGLAEVQVVTEDGSRGLKGLVTEALPREGTFYACGPVGMLRAVATHAQRSGQKAYLALEAIMGCGFGACLGCTVPLAHPDPRQGAYGRYARVCLEGPVFPAEEVVL